MKDFDDLQKSNFEIIKEIFDEIIKKINNKITNGNDNLVGGSPVFSGPSQSPNNSNGVSSFIKLTDTPPDLGTKGQAVVVNDDVDALIFDGPFQRLPAPDSPTNVRATDAFDSRLKVNWNSVEDAESYEWQQRTNGDSWLEEDGTSTESINSGSITVTNAGQDFRVRSVGQGEVLKSDWTELLNIPVIDTPTPDTATSLNLRRVSPGKLRFSWDDLDVNNGGSGSKRVTKNASYRYQYREEGDTTWGSTNTTGTGASVDVSNLTNGTNYEMRVYGTVTNNDGDAVNGEWSETSDAERPVKNTVTINYGVSDSRTDDIINSRTLEVSISGGSEFDAISSSYPITNGQYNVIDIERGDEYAQVYNLSVLETRPLVTDITTGSSYEAETEPNSGPRRYSIGPSTAVNVTVTWYLEVE